MLQAQDVSSSFPPNKLRLVLRSLHRMLQF